MRSLRFKILAIAATLVVLSQVGTVGAVLFTARQDVAERASRSLQTGAAMLAQVIDRQARQFENTVNALAADYGLKQVVGTGDAPTVRSALNNHARRAGADIAFLFDNEQRLIAAVGEHGLSDTQTAALLQATHSNTPGHTALIGVDMAYEVVTVPVRAPLPIARLSMGFALTDRYAENLGRLTGLNVSILATDGRRSRVVASSLPSARRTDLLGVGAVTPYDISGSSLPQVISVGDNEYLALRRPIINADGTLSVLLTRSIADAMAPYKLLQTAAIALAAIPLIAALIGAVLLSRALTQPVQKLMQAARRIQSGDYSTSVAIRSGDELSEFAVAFNSMQAEIAQREERISYQARHDSSTGLFNRDYALELLGQQIAETGPQGHLAVVMVSLNAFEEISGTLGHDIADSYLKQAAAKLRQLIDSSYALARLEADTFLVLLKDADTTSAERRARELVAQLKPGIRLPDVNVAVSPTIGVAVYPEHALDRERLLLRATIAIGAGTERQHPVHFYREGDEEQRLRNMTLLQDLRRAVHNDELLLHYQPKIAVACETVCGVEALVRWDHPKYGRLPPNEFIPIIEQSGNISLLTRWALDTAARQHREWLDDELDLSVAVNFSAHDLQDQDLPWFVMDILRDNDLPPEKLVIEITEEAMVRDFANAITVLRRLRDLGIRLSIDDFGTGYSSLSQIKKLPVDELKIDRSFMAQIPDDRADAAIVASSVELAHNLDLEIVAEGVANGAAFRWLQQHGVDRAQGFYWSPPMPAAELADWVRDFSGGETRETKTLKLI